MVNSAKYHSYNGARTDLLELGAYDYSQKRVLDIGCYRGANAKYLKYRFDGVTYIGIEGDSFAISHVYEEVDEISESDLDTMDFTLLGNKKFDFVLLGDVIEHLKNPEQFMNRLKTIVDHNTKIFVSIPNIQYYETFFLLMRGRFPRRERGLFDKTHLRWFTNREFRLMIEGGYEVLYFSRSFRLVDGNCCSRLNRYNRYAMPLFKILAPFFTYQLQYVLQVRK